MIKIIFILLSLFFSLSALGFDHSHKNWTTVLKSYQTAEGLVKYKKLQSDLKLNKSHVFHMYLTELQAVPETDFERFSKNEKMAFLINAYNALTFKLIIDHYPVTSIKKIGGFFSKPWSLEFFSLLGGKIKSLDPIEHKWLRPIYKDYRIHAAVNCASISCPPLRNEAFEAGKLDQQLDDQMKVWLKDQKRNQISIADKTFRISKIFDWYKADFESWGGGVLNVISKYLSIPNLQEDSKKIKIQYLDYDWNLNEAP